VIPFRGQKVLVNTDDGIRQGVCIIAQPRTRGTEVEEISLIEIEGQNKWYSHSKLQMIGSTPMVNEK
jgi:hypothetical protein